MSALLMFLASPQNTAVSAEFCWLSSRGMFMGNGGLNRNKKQRDSSWRNHAVMNNFLPKRAVF
jgi:hypothetical protein